MSEKPLRMRRFLVHVYPEQTEPVPSWAAGVAWDGKNERNGSNRRGWMYNCWFQEVKILAEMEISVQVITPDGDGGIP